MYQLRGVIPVRSYPRQPAPPRVTIERPDVGLRWGAESQFLFQPGGGGEGSRLGGGSGMSVVWPDDSNMAPPIEVSLPFFGEYLDVSYIRVRGEPSNKDVWAIVMTPNRVCFTNTQPTQSPSGAAGSLTTIYDLQLTLHQEGEHVSGPNG